MEKYVAEIQELGVVKQSVEFSTKEEREKWINHFEPKVTRSWSGSRDTYNFPYNHDLTIRVVDVNIQNLDTNVSVEDWINSKVVVARLRGNTEKPLVTSSFTGNYIVTGISNMYIGT